MSTTENEERDDGLTPEESLALEALLTGATHQAAGEIIGKSAKTVQRMRKQPHFAAAIEARQADRLSTLTHGIETRAIEAVHVIDELLHDGPPATRLAAARLSLNTVLRFRAALDMDVRIAAVERVLLQNEEGDQ